MRSASPPVGFTLGDATATGGALSNLQQLDATHFSATFTAAAATETQTASVSVAAASYTDAAGNPGTAGSTGSFIVDTVAPSIAIASIAGDDTVSAGEAAAGFAISGTTADVEDGQSVTVAIHDAANAVVDSYTTAVAGAAWSVSVTPVQATALADGSYSVTADVADHAGNPASTASRDVSVVCYVRGTNILTPRGEVRVEHLAVGQSMLTASGTTRLVKWIGHRSIDFASHPRPESVAPIRIRRGAFADNMPHRDLLMSPDHAVFVDGKLICARQLANGTTIRREVGWISVEYFHVELDIHEILFAEGLPSESYLNTGNCSFFANSDKPLVLHPDLTDESDYPTRAAGSCEPFVTDEASVRPVWQRLSERAAALGQPVPAVATTTDPALHIVAAGRTIRPIYADGKLCIFPLPRNASPVRLVSRACTPSEARPWLDDPRRLGVPV